MSNNFKPMDLNAESVNNIYFTCKPSDKTKEIFRISFQKKEMGFPSDSKPLIFDAESIDKNISNIFFLFGQLKSAHSQDQLFPMKDMLKKYDGTFWTNDKATPMYLMHLGIAAGAMLPPYASSKTSILSSDLIPTLSPNDSRFDEWFKQYSSKTLKKSGGKEPADD